jgi:hypothetical protein
VQTVKLGTGSFNPLFFDSASFSTVQIPEDFRVIYLNRFARWIDFKITAPDAFYYRGFRLEYDKTVSQEEGRKSRER